MASDLLQAQFNFSTMLAPLLTQAFQLGYQVTLGEAYRTAAQAALNAQAGVGIVHSLHTQRLAIDLQLFRDGQYLPDSKDYQSLGEWWVALGVKNNLPLAWGGTFEKADGNHFSLAFGGVR